MKIHAESHQGLPCSIPVQFLSEHFLAQVYFLILPTILRIRCVRPFKSDIELWVVGLF